MATEIQFRRGTTSQHSSFTGAVGEITVDTDKDTAVVHNNSTAGGIPLAKEVHSNKGFDHANAAFAKANTAGAGTANSITVQEIAGGAVQSNSVADNIALTNVTITTSNTTVANVVQFNATHIALGEVSGTATVNTYNGTYFSANTTGACTWTFTGGPDSSKAAGFVLELTSGAGNTGTAYTQTWPAAVKWPGGSAPTLSQGETKVDVLVFITDDGGTTWRGALSQQDSS